MKWWGLTREAGDTFLVQHGVVAAFAYPRTGGGRIAYPGPGDFLMLVFGVRVREGSITLWQVIAAIEAGTILGSSLLYLLGRERSGSCRAFRTFYWHLTLRSSTGRNDCCSATAPSR